MTTAAETAAKIEKLPKWAQEHIALLHQRLNESRKAEEAATARAVGGTYGADTDTFFYDYSAHGSHRPLPRRASVRFVFPASPARAGDLRNYVDAALDYEGPDGPWLRLMASDTLIVMPQSGNVAKVTLSDSHLGREFLPAHIGDPRPDSVERAKGYAAEKIDQQVALYRHYRTGGRGDA